jgi:hypothetical protein
MKWRVRLWGKKKGGRMTGWWIMGSLGEAAFFAACFLVGVLGLSTFVNWFAVGGGYWLLVAVSTSLVIMGVVGFWLGVLKVAMSDEHREAIAQSGLLPKPKGRPKKSPPPMIPSLQVFTESPGAKLAFRLPQNSTDKMSLIAVGILAMSWNAMLAIFLVVAVKRMADGRIPWTLFLLMAAGIYIGWKVTRLFFRYYVQAIGIGSTTVEIEDLPLHPGKSYRVILVQYGKLAIKKLSLRLVCEEESSYHFGTDVRSERSVVEEQLVLSQGRTRIDWGRPLQLEGVVQIPVDAMHSFQSLHNAIHWKFIVEGEANRWPSYCRSFPVVVYPRVANMSTDVPS